MYQRPRLQVDEAFKCVALNPSLHVTFACPPLRRGEEKSMLLACSAVGPSQLDMRHSHAIGSQVTGGLPVDLITVDTRDIEAISMVEGRA
eukprot:756311-Hanusia_phi.AAC.2